MPRQTITAIGEGFLQMERTNKKGKVKRRVALEIKTSPVLFDADEISGAKPAQAIAAEIEEGLDNGGTVKLSTVDRRIRYAKGAQTKANGERSQVAGPAAPNQTSRM